MKIRLMTSFPLPRFEDIDVTAAGELFVLHDDRETLSLYRPDAAAGFRLQWTRPAPAAPAGKSWWWIRAAGDGCVLLHALDTETVLLDADGSEAARWEVKDLFLMAGGSSRVVYREGTPRNYQLHVYGVTDHNTRLFSLTPRDGGSWGEPAVSISPAGTLLVADITQRLLVAFSSTGERLYQRNTTYPPLWYIRAVSADDQHLFVCEDNDRDVIHVHAAASGDHVTTLTASRLRLESGEWIAAVWAGLGQTLFVWAQNGDNDRMIALTGLGI